MVTNLASHAEDTGWILGQGTDIPRATGQLSPPATTTAVTCSGAHMLQLRGPCAETKSPSAITSAHPTQPKENKETSAKKYTHTQRSYSRLISGIYKIHKEPLNEETEHPTEK